MREIYKRRDRRKRWRKIWSMMAALAAFTTTYVLILPAITMSRQLVCGKTEHTHAEACYEQQSGVICGLESGESHDHTDACFTLQAVWICGLEETEGHDHTESCYERQTVNVCGLEETEGHSHTEVCQEEQTVTICSLEEKQPHTHTAECSSQEQKLVCGLEIVQPHTHSENCAGEEKTLTCTLPETENHEHSESCYELQNVLVCTEEEHTHTEFCYDVGPADANADVETQQDWEKSISEAELGDNAAENVAAVALTQLGYQESSRNYVLVDELTLNGYTRYGGWYGDPYGDWDAMFASFVLHYAGVEDLGSAADPNEWAKQIAQERPQRYKTAQEYTPGMGDLVFFDQDQDGEIDRVGLFLETTEDAWRVIEGNAEDMVSVISYAPGDGRIVAYGLISEESGELTEAAEYTVTYMANNGTEETAQQQGSTVVIASCDGFTVPEGMIFIGWNTEADGSGTDYDEALELTLTEDLTLYAQWIQEITAGSGFVGSVWTQTRSTAALNLAKQIEWTGANTDDYSYRLHLTLDGSSLSAGSVTTVEPTEKRNIGILLDVTETMLSTWSGSENGGNKFDAVRALLQGADGFLDSILDGNTNVSIIVVGGQSGDGTYERLSDQIAAGDSMDDFSNINNSLHLAQGISYVTGLKAAEKYLENDIDSLVYIVGNAPDTYVKYSDGALERGTTGTQAQTKNYNDYVAFMGNHPELSMYMVGVAPVERGAETAQKMGQYSVDRGTGGGYYEAGNTDELKQQLENIAQQIVVPADKVTSITIQDQLSQYVTLNGDSDITATLLMLDSEGNTTSTTDITEKVSIENGILTCAYPDEIEGPFKIEIAFNIKTADGVYRTYSATGETGTDWGRNTTSSGKEGFYSNGDAAASYTLNDTATTSNFPHPVVQAPEKATVKLTKVWVDASDEDKTAVTVNLHRGAADGDLVGTVVLDQENNWTASCDVKILTAEGTSNTIYIVEQTVDGFTATYSAADNVTVAAGKTYEITVTNTKQVVEKTASLTVNKIWQQVAGSQQAVIHVGTYGGLSMFTDLEGSPFTVSSGENATKEFTVKWTGEEAPQIYIYEEQSDLFYPVMSGDGNQNNVTLGSHQVSAQALIPESEGEYHVTLTNMASVQMPATGGPGTQAYVFGGFVLIISALLLMQIEKRKFERRA